MNFAWIRLSLTAALVFGAAGWADAQPPADRETAMQGGGVTQDDEIDDARARVHFRTANELYERGDFERSAVQFEEAYRLSRRPELLYNAYVAYREAGSLRAAASSLELYLQEATNITDRTNLEARLAQLRQSVADQDARETELDRARREAVEQARQAEIDAAVAREQTESLERSGEAWPWIVLGVGGATLVASLITGIAAVGSADSLAADCPEQLCDPEEVTGEELDSRREDALLLANVTDVLWISGAAISILGVVFVFAAGLPRNAPEEEELDTTGVDLDLSCGLAGCTVTGSF